MTNEGWSIPTEPSGHRSDKLIGELVALRPITDDEQTLDTSQGPAIARFVECLVITDESPDGYLNLGEIPIFWQVVRRQLNDARPWIVGRIVKAEGSRAYRLVPPAREDAGKINAVLRRHRERPRPVEPLDEEPDEDGFIVPDTDPLG